MINILVHIFTCLTSISRSEECPYRHELPSDPNDPLSNQNLKDRYYGLDDPVAEKLLSKFNELPKSDPNKDSPSSKSLNDYVRTRISHLLVL